MWGNQLMRTCKKQEFENMTKVAEEIGLINADFVPDFAKRAASKEWYQFLNGNTICELNTKNGTQVMTTKDDEFNLEYPVNIDINISNKCIINCPFCYQGCSATGKEANIKGLLKNKKSFLYSLHGGTELAINGNEPLHPDLPLLLKFCKKRNIFANLTVNEKTFLAHEVLLSDWMQKGLIHGLGISPSLYTKRMISFASLNQNVVIHTIAGITTKKDYIKLFQNNIKVLILGYKQTGRGVAYCKENPSIAKNKSDLKMLLKALAKYAGLISFDNLAIQQLDPKVLLSLSDEEYETLFRGSDGQHTMFMDLVSETYAINSIQSRKNHKPITGSVEEMFSDIKNQIASK